MTKNLFFLLSLTVLLMSSCEKQEQHSQFLHLWYKQPAQIWEEALPIGNGRLGAMVFGGIDTIRIQLNEESIWAGMQQNNLNPNATEQLPEIRELLFNDKNKEAFELASKVLLRENNKIRSYQLLGDLLITLNDELESISGYERSLDLASGVTKVECQRNGYRYTQEAFASAPDDVIVIHLETEDPKGLSGSLNLTRPQGAVAQVISDNEIRLVGQIIDAPDLKYDRGGEHMCFEGRLKVVNEDGTVNAVDDHLEFSGISKVTVILTAGTDYNLEKLDFDRSIDPASKVSGILNKVVDQSYLTLKEKHKVDHESFFNRLDLQLTQLTEDTVPTDIRLANVKAGEEDLHIVELYFQYGRYLLMGSSRSPGILPANLQGIWNHHINAPWNSDFHVNINLQMNYWPAEVCNLSETMLPMAGFFQKISQIPGPNTAKMYGCNGWTMHHLTDPFGRTGIMDGIEWGMFPLGGSWVCFPIWRHFEFTNDPTYLEEIAWPMLKGNAQFILDFLVEGPSGYLVTAPSYSPENHFYLPGSDEHTRLTYAPTMDIQIINELFKYCKKAARIVGGEEKLLDRINEAEKLLPPVVIGEDGTIQEWIKDYREAEPGHRHMSHLLGLHPGTTITPETVDLFEAAQKTIERRLQHGGGGTGWSRAWIINFYARLLDGDNAYKHFNALMKHSTYNNLFDGHTPFQIDGNFGGTAGIAEMLLQSHNNLIHLLPALPSSWKKGHIEGIKARGNFELDLYWKNGQLEKVTVYSNSNHDCNLKYMDKEINFETVSGKSYSFNGKLERL
ncbi:glycoside hydrolase family 95 protein [Sunxiuqinia sp. sy24]|uniref:glycoside hydrolase family 95 protein n=1 Tax=Sunxiuqinia sp. sy24 TaxID=3461495 RepID=UPI004045E8DF